MSSLTIGQLAAQAGCRTSTLRYYESLGLLPPVERVNGRRSYDPAHGQRLSLIRSARAAGFSLREIARFLDGFSPATTASDRWQVLVAAKLIETDQELIDLQQRRKRLRLLQACLCVGVDECAEKLSA